MNDDINWLEKFVDWGWLVLVAAWAHVYNKARTHVKTQKEHSERITMLEANETRHAEAIADVKTMIETDERRHAEAIDEVKALIASGQESQRNASNQIREDLRTLTTALLTRNGGL